MIYFASNGAGQIKIGYARDTAKRLTALKTASPEIRLIGSMEGSRGHERTLHDCLADFHISGEWFRDCEEVRAAMACAMQDGVPEWKSDRTRNHAPSEWDIKAKELIAILTDGKSVEQLPEVEISFGLPPNFLWRMKYRQAREVSVGEYFSLLRATSKALEIRRSALEHHADFVRSLEMADAESDNGLFDTERAYRAMTSNRLDDTMNDRGFDPPGKV